MKVNKLLSPASPWPTTPRSSPATPWTSPKSPACVLKTGWIERPSLSLPLHFSISEFPSFSTASGSTTPACCRKTHRPRPAQSRLRHRHPGCLDLQLYATPAQEFVKPRTSPHLSGGWVGRFPNDAPAGHPSCFCYLEAEGFRILVRGRV